MRRGRRIIRSCAAGLRLNCIKSLCYTVQLAVSDETFKWLNDTQRCAAMLYKHCWLHTQAEVVHIRHRPTFTSGPWPGAPLTPCLRPVVDPLDAGAPRKRPRQYRRSPCRSHFQAHLCSLSGKNVLHSFAIIHAGAAHQAQSFGIHCALTQCRSRVEQS